MSKFILTIEGSSLQEVINQFRGLPNNEEIKEELAEGNLPTIERDRKSWTDFELNFLKENYHSKNLRWIGLKLRRNPKAIYQKLSQMYKQGLPKKQPRKFKNL